MVRPRKGGNGGGQRSDGWIEDRGNRGWGLAGAATLVLATAVGVLGGRAQSAPGQLPASPTAAVPAAAPAEKTASAATAAAGQTAQATDAGDQARKQELAKDCADLLKMATELKTAVDGSTKDQLSVTVVRRAGEIELLAHKARTGSTRN